MSYRNPKTANTGSQVAQGFQNMQNQIAGAYGKVAQGEADIAKSEADTYIAKMKENEKRNIELYNKSEEAQDKAAISFNNGGNNTTSIDTSDFGNQLDLLDGLVRKTGKTPQDRIMMASINAGGETSRAFVVEIEAKKQAYLDMKKNTLGGVDGMSRYSDPAMIEWNDILFRVPGAEGSSKFKYSNNKNGELEVDLEIYNKKGELIKTINNKSEYGFPSPQKVPNLTENGTTVATTTLKTLQLGDINSGIYDGGEFKTSTLGDGTKVYTSYPNKETVLKSLEKQAEATITNLPGGAGATIAWWNNAGEAVNGGILLKQRSGWKMDMTSQDGEVSFKSEGEVKKMLGRAYAEQVYEENKASFNKGIQTTKRPVNTSTGFDSNDVPSKFIESIKNNMESSINTAFGFDDGKFKNGIVTTSRLRKDSNGSEVEEKIKFDLTNKAQALDFFTRLAIDDGLFPKAGVTKTEKARSEYQRFKVLVREFAEDQKDLRNKAKAAAKKAGLSEEITPNSANPFKKPNYDNLGEVV